MQIARSSSDRVRIEPDEEHWHDAPRTGSWSTSPSTRSTTSTPPPHWGEHVTDAEYHAHD